MRVEAFERHDDGIGGEALEFEFPACAAVERVGVLRAKPGDVEISRPGADFFVRRERDPDDAVRDLRMRDQVLCRGHDRRDA